jgi:hypothetical protein
MVARKVWIRDQLGVRAAIVSLVVALGCAPAAFAQAGDAYTEPAPKPQEKKHSVDFVNDFAGGSASAPVVDSGGLEKGVVLRSARSRHTGLADARSRAEQVGITSAAPEAVSSDLAERADLAGNKQAGLEWAGFVAAALLLTASLAIELLTRRRTQHPAGRLAS